MLSNMLIEHFNQNYFLLIGSRPSFIHSCITWIMRHSVYILRLRQTGVNFKSRLTMFLKQSKVAVMPTGSLGKEYTGSIELDL